MANKTNNTKSTEKKEKIIKEDIIDNEVKPVEEEILEDGNVEEKENETVALLKAQLEEMQKAMEQLMNKQADTPSQKVVFKAEEDEVSIGCRVLQGIGWGDPADPSGLGEIRLGFNEEQTLTVSDMKKFFRQHSIRKLFEDGLCYFVDPSNYVLFNVKKHIDLSDETLIKILDRKDVNEVIRDLNDLTDSKKNSAIVNCIIFRICDMIRKGDLNWEYYTRTGIEAYFNMQFDRGIVTLNAVESFR